MNTFQLIDIAFTALERRKNPPVRSSADKSYMTSHGQKDASPTDGPRTARAIDPNYCEVCTPKGRSSCECDIACNE